jgi:hypothetical protein
MPLEGGARMKLELQARARKWASRSVDVGFFDPEHATVAAINEYGAPAGPKNGRIPHRPFMRLAILDGKVNWAKSLAERIKAGDTSKKALDATGRDMVQDIRVSLHSPWQFQVNAKRTIKIKGFDLPLFQTGAFLGPAIKHKVRV